MVLINAKKRVVVTFFLFLILIMQTSNPVLSYTVLFEEDFSDPELPDWTMTGWYYCDPTSSIRIPTGFGIQNGELVEAGGATLDSWCQENLAIHENPVEFGKWSFDYYHGSNVGLWSITFIDDYKQDGKLSSEQNDTRTIIQDGDDYRFIYLVSEASINYEQGTSFSNSTNGTIDYILGEWYHIDVIRNTTGFFTYIENQFHYNQNLGPEYNFDYNYVILNAPWGSKVRYDNFVISDLFGEETTGNFTSTNNSDKGSIKWQYILIGISLGTISIFYMKTIGKKNF